MCFSRMPTMCNPSLPKVVPMHLSPMSIIPSEAKREQENVSSYQTSNIVYSWIFGGVHLFSTEECQETLWTGPTKQHLSYVPATRTSRLRSTKLLSSEPRLPTWPPNRSNYDGARITSHLLATISHLPKSTLWCPSSVFWCWHARLNDFEKARTHEQVERTQDEIDADVQVANVVLQQWTQNWAMLQQYSPLVMMWKYWFYCLILILLCNLLTSVELTSSYSLTICLTLSINFNLIWAV